MRGQDQSKEALAQLLEQIAHDLRSRAGVMLGALGQIELGGDAERNRTAVAIARRSVQKVLLMADRLHSTGELHAGRAHWNLQPRDLKELVQRAVEAASSIEARRGIELDLRLPAAACVVPLHAEWILLAVTELVVRAILGARKRVVIEIEDGPESVVLTVSDDGSPLPSPLPTRFPAVAREQTLGLVLSLAADVAHAHGARFTAGEQCSDQPAGACTRFEFARSAAGPR